MAREIIQPVSVHSTAGAGYSHVAKAGLQTEGGAGLSPGRPSVRGRKPRV